MNEPFGLGRLKAPDERDEKYLIKSALPAESEREERTWRYWWPSGWWGDQQNTPMCVAFAWAHWVEDGPITQPNTQVDPSWLYSEAQKLDEWVGDDYAGTSVRAGARALQRREIIKEYRWAWDVETAIHTILHAGPIVLGTWWYHDMFFPDEEGFVKPAGRRVGGHAYVANGVNTERGIMRFKNSWGRVWGKRGYFYMDLDHVDQLIREGGEVCLALENRIGPS